jgi:hypothetical protein
MKNIFYAFCLLLTFGWSVDLDAQPFDVVWTDLVGVSASGNTITKTAAIGWANGGAASTNILGAGLDGWAECETQEIDKRRFFGLSEMNTNESYSTIQYSIYLRNDALALVYENGVYQSAFTTYTSGDLFQIERVASTIFYNKNGVTFYTSSTASTSSLIVDVSLVENNSTIKNAKTSFNVPSTNDWTLNGNDIFYDAGIVSVNTANTTKAFSVENTASGQTEFQVNGDGKVYAREVEVTLSAFPDYVFEDEYPLMSLKELKDFIEKNGHLPNIPKGEDIDNNGIGLGDLSHKQMEKIEELTLYILQLDDRLKKLEKENKVLKNNEVINSSLDKSDNSSLRNTPTNTKVQSATPVKTNEELILTPPTTDWQLNGSDIFYDAGIVSVNTANTTKAFSVENTNTNMTEFQVNGDGKVYAREVEVTMNTFPDYVFEDKYPLMSLNNLKTFIAGNKHLPNIPSAKIIDNEGIGLGDLSHKKMEKIEELTLYILQLNERIQDFEN